MFTGNLVKDLLPVFMTPPETGMDLVMQLQEELPKSIVYYGQECLEEKGEHFDELGVFLPFTHFSERLEKHIETAKKIVYQYKE